VTAEPAIRSPEPSTPEPSARQPRRRPRRPVRRSLIVTHRWISLTLGLLLVVITTSGAILLYEPEYFRATHGSLFRHTHSAAPVSMGQAIAVVNRTHPGFHATTVNFDHGVYEIGSADESTGDVYGVDPGTGRITGKADLNGGMMGFVVNLHACGLTCDNYPGYVGFLATSMPTLGMKWLTGVTIGGFMLGVMGLFLLFLGLSGVVIWWPGIKRWRHGVRVRWQKGRYARDYDLHKVAGMAAIPFLLVWGLTGSSFELPFVGTAWYAVTGGKPPAAEAAPITPAKAATGARDISADTAVAAAVLVSGGRATHLTLPSAADPDYTVGITAGHDPWGHSLYPGQVVIAVDRHDARHTKVTTGAHGATVSNTVWDNWRAPVFHYGYAVNGWWRLIWLVFGLSPLLLAATGLSTWLAKRSVRKRRKAAA
jgi:uncharacterized iron-regulated membrane protein